MSLFPTPLANPLQLVNMETGAPSCLAPNSYVLIISLEIKIANIFRFSRVQRAFQLLIGIIKIWDSFWLFLFLTYVVVWSPTLCQDLCDDPCWTHFLLLSQFYNGDCPVTHLGEIRKPQLWKAK